MSHAGGTGWPLGQPAALNSKYVYKNFVQRVPEYIRNKLPVILGVIISPSANRTLFSIWIPAFYSGIVSLFSKSAWFCKTSSKTGASESHLLVFSNTLQFVYEASTYEASTFHSKWEWGPEPPLDTTVFLEF